MKFHHAVQKGAHSIRMTAAAASAVEAFATEQQIVNKILWNYLWSFFIYGKYYYERRWFSSFDSQSVTFAWRLHQAIHHDTLQLYSNFFFFFSSFLSLWNMDDVMGAYRKKNEKCHKNFSTKDRAEEKEQHRTAQMCDENQVEYIRMCTYIIWFCFSRASSHHQSAVHVLLIVCAQRWWQSSAIHLLQWHAHKTWSRIKWNVIRHKR